MPQTKSLLVVGMADSPHLQTWLQEVAGLDIFKKVYVFPTSSPAFIKFRPVRRVSKLRFITPLGKSNVASLSYSLLDRIYGDSWRSLFLKIVIKLLSPSIVHVHECQHSAYLFTNSMLKKKKYKLILSTWGSDIILYGRLQSHKERLSQFLSKTNYLLSERSDDLIIAKQLGFIGVGLSPSYITVGFNNQSEELSLASTRKLIVVKGYQDNHGRALNAIEAIRQVKHLLSGYRIVVISASEPVRLMVDHLSSVEGLTISCAPKLTNSEVRNLFRNARIYIGLAISDGISNTMVESMQEGCFPIQSENSCAPTFLTHGLSGYIVNPWDLASLTQYMELALTDNALVDGAMKINAESLARNFDKAEGLSLLRNFYVNVLKDL